MAMPAVLLDRICPRQHPARALHREVQGMQQAAHMAGMVMHAKLLLDHPGDHRRSPYSGIQTIGDGTAVENIPELFPLLRRQLGRAPGTIALQQTVDSVSLIMREPFRHLGSGRLENVCNLAAGATLRI